MGGGVKREVRGCGVFGMPFFRPVTFSCSEPDLEVCQAFALLRVDVDRAPHWGCGQRRRARSW